MAETFDAIVVGAGQAGPSLAVRLAGAGRKVALIERRLLGGTCVNTGCTPTKALVASAYAAHVARRAADYGVKAGPVIADFAAVMARMDGIVAKSRSGLEKWLGSTRNLTVIYGAAQFAGPKALRVNGRVLRAGQIFLNVGASAHIPDLPGVKSVPFLTYSSLLELKELPEHLVVVGGGAVGLEFAQVFRRLGSQVTIVERYPRLASGEDEDVSKTVEEIFVAEGIAIRTSAACIHLEKTGEGIRVGLDCDTDARHVDGSHALLAVGRKPNTAELNLAAAGVEVDKEGYIRVDDQLRTTAPWIFALGDCNGHGGFTHTSYNDYEIVAENLLDGAARRVTDRIRTYATFLDPPMARAGMSESEVRKSGRPALVGFRPMARVSRANEKGETTGFMKVLVDKETEQILGATVFGVGGDEAVHCILTCMYAKQPASLLRHSVHIHPTVAELIPTVFGELKALG